MKAITTLIPAMVLSMINLISAPVHGKEIFGSTGVTAVTQRTVTPNVLNRASVLKIQKPKLFVGNPHKLSVLADDSDDNTVEVDDIITAYRRRDLQQIRTDATPDNPHGLNDNIRWRLFLARQLALIKYRELHNLS